MPSSKSFPCYTLAVACLIAMPAHAEAPMNTDDAGTLERGRMKLETTLSRHGQQRGGELLLGFSAIEHLELEVASARAVERINGPHTRLNGIGFGAKWVPYQNATGWSLGARYDHHRIRVTDHREQDRLTEKEQALTALASYRLADAQVLHFNLGAVHTHTGGQSARLGTWGIGYELPLHETLQLTLESFGLEHAGPDKAIGLRYRMAEGVKIAAAMGRGNARRFGQLGLAWEF